MNKLKEIIIMYKQNLLHIQKLEKRIYNKDIKLRNTYIMKIFG